MNAMLVAEQSSALKTVAHWIGGQPVPSRSGRFGPIWDPATGDVQGRVAFASAEEVDHAVAVASSRSASVVDIVDKGNYNKTGNPIRWQNTKRNTVYD